MMQVDWWSWKCSRCDYKVLDDRTMNSYVLLAEALMRKHIKSHESATSSDALLTRPEGSQAIGSATQDSSSLPAVPGPQEGEDVAASGSQGEGATGKPALVPLPDAAVSAHIDAVRYARSYVVPLYRDDEEGTPYERGAIKQIAHHWLVGYFSAKPLVDDAVAPSSPARAEGPTHEDCINCGEANDGGFMTGGESSESGNVGPFCSTCWEFTREHFHRFEPPVVPPAAPGAEPSVEISAVEFHSHLRWCKGRHNARRLIITDDCNCGAGKTTSSEAPAPAAGGASLVRDTKRLATSLALAIEADCGPDAWAATARQIAAAIDEFPPPQGQEER